MTKKKNNNNNNKKHPAKIGCWEQKQGTTHAPCPQHQ